MSEKDRYTAMNDEKSNHLGSYDIVDEKNDLGLLKAYVVEGNG